MHINPLASSAGRLDTPRLFNQYPNVAGPTGIRDLGDIKNVPEIAKDPLSFAPIDMKYFVEHYPNIETREKLLIANFIQFDARKPGPLGLGGSALLF